MSRPNSKAAIVERYNAGEELVFVQFWNERLPDRRAYFNQWHPAKFVHQGFEFSNAEQAMMAEKAFLFKDFGTLAKIFETTSPRAVKELGRQVHSYVDPEWAAVRVPEVFRVNVSKYSQNAEMLKALLDTGDAILVEASPEDRLWGIGMTESDPRTLDPNLWLGENYLGEVLMDTRELLRHPFGA